jgi:predicted RNA-binding protein with PIN domain
VADELYILDGDNVTHVRGAGSDYARAREELVGDVSGFASEAGIDVVLVFDGTGSGRRIGRLQVVYSGRETADTIIERLAHRRAGEAPGSVTVVSNDTVLRHVAQRGGVHAMSAREFLDRLGAAPAQRPVAPESRGRTTLGDTLDPGVREALERIRRGE